MGNPIYYPPCPSPGGAPPCEENDTLPARPHRRDLTAEVAGALADADFYFGRAPNGGPPRARRGGVDEGEPADHPPSAWGVGFRWGLPPLPAATHRGGPGPDGPAWLGLPPPRDAAAATAASTSAASSLDRLRRELMLSALDPSDWDAAFGGGGGGGGAGGGRRAWMLAPRALPPPPPLNHPSTLATALLRASAGDAAARVLEVQATLAALEGRLGALQAARRARAAATVAAGRMV